jgi:uncharacterized cupredoxin-like copper-binding protein
VFYCPRLAVILSLVLLALFGASLARAQQAATVSMVDLRFNPPTLTATAGQPVSWTFHNHGTLPHDFQVDVGGAAIELVPGAASLAAGQSATFDFTFDTPGTYAFWCPVPGHRESGMVGTLTVEAASAPAPGPIPAPEPPPAPPTVPAPSQPPVTSPEATFCPPGQDPHFVFGFADLKAFIGEPMGQPLTCEFPDPNGTGDIHQFATTGLAFWRKSTNTPTFTNGYEHWGRTDRGWVYWLGDSIDPPPDAMPLGLESPTPPEAL